MEVKDQAITIEKINDLLKALSVSATPTDDKFITEKALSNYVASGNGGKPKQIANVDLNTITATGFYSCDMCTNRPNNSNGNMLVLKNAGTSDNAVQIYWTFQNDTMWVRHKDLGNWKDWIKTNNLTASDILATNDQTIQENIERIDEDVADRQITYLITEYPSELDSNALYRIEEEFTHEEKTYTAGLYQVVNDELVKIESGSTEIINDLVHTDTDKALSANMGKVLNEKKITSEKVFDDTRHPLVIYYDEDAGEAVVPSEFREMPKGSSKLFSDSYFGTDPTTGISCAPPEDDTEVGFEVLVTITDIAGSLGDFPMIHMLALNTDSGRLWRRTTDQDYQLSEWEQLFSSVDVYTYSSNSNLTKDVIGTYADKTGACIMSYAKLGSDRPTGSDITANTFFSVYATSGYFDPVNSAKYYFIQVTVLPVSVATQGQSAGKVFTCVGVSGGSGTTWTDWQESGGSDVAIIDNLTSTRTDAALSAKQGKSLNESKVASNQSVLTDVSREWLLDNVTEGYNRVKIYESVIFSSGEAPIGYTNQKFSVLVNKQNSNDCAIFAFAYTGGVFYSLYSYRGFEDWIRIATSADLQEYQPLLESGSNIKTLNGYSLLGSGNMATPTGVKGKAESSYRTGNVNITPENIGLDKVPNVATNDQTPTFTQASSLANIASGEKLSVIFGKVMKAIADLISHIGNKSNPHAVTKSQVGLGNVANTGDSATPVSGGTTKFTTGGAYTELAKKVDKTSITENTSTGIISITV